MKYIWFNIKSFFIKKKLIFILSFFSIICSCIMIHFSYGLYQNYQLKKQYDLSDERKIVLTLQGDFDETSDNELNDDEKENLLKQIEKIDFSILDLINHQNEEKKKGVITPLKGCLSVADIERNREEYTNVGIDAIRQGKVAALLLAGGQGTRLGSDKPKGMYNIGITKDVYIFEMIVRNLMDVVNQTGTWIPLYVMTSEKNNDDTVKFFKDMNYFGYDKDYVDFFVQEMAPASTFDGKIYLEEKGMSQKQLAIEIGISLSRVNDYIAGRSEPTWKIARLLCRILNIPPGAMLGF